MNLDSYCSSGVFFFTLFETKPSSFSLSEPNLLFFNSRYSSEQTLQNVVHVFKFFCVSLSPVMAGRDLELALVSDTRSTLGSDRLVSLRNSCFFDS